MSGTRPGAKIEKHFQKLVERFDEDDIGITVFNQRLERLTDAANEDGGSFSDLIEPGIEALNKDWRYHDEIATVTGRLYAVSPEVIDELVIIFGEAESDQNGDVFFFVEDAELVSNGIIDGPHGYGLDGAAARIAYGFSHPEIDCDFAQLALYPGESYRHQYSVPTPEAIDAALHRRWPSEMEVVDNLIKFSDDPLKIPKRLTLLARRLQPTLHQSSDFREWLSVYVNERVKLAQVWPYYLELEDKLYLQDGEGDNSWFEISFEKTLPLYARKPRFEFVYSNDFETSSDGVHAMLFMEIPEDGDEWAGSEIGINVGNIATIRGTSPLRSLIDKALYGSERDIDAVMAFAEDENSVTPRSVEPVLQLVGPEKTDHTGDPEYIEEMRLLQNELDSVLRDYKEAFAKRYDTSEQALEVAGALTNTIANRLVGAGIMNYTLEFDGPYAIRTKKPQEKRADQIEAGEFYLNFDIENPFVQLQHGDTFRATFYAFLNDVTKVHDEATGEDRYTPLTRMVVELGSNNTQHIVYNHAPLVEINVTARGLVSMDGTVRVVVPSLVRYNKDKDARFELAKAVTGDPVVEKVHRLYSALQRETPEGFQDLKNIDVFRSVARRLKMRDHPGHTQIMNAFESLLLKRKIAVDGLVIDMSGEAQLIQMYDGIVEDVRMDHPLRQDPGPYLVMIGGDGEHTYVAAETITALLF